MKCILGFVAILLWVSFLASTQAQEVSIPDPGLNTAIRLALQKPSEPLTEQDLLSLTNLNACCRSVSSVQGLEAARNLTLLDLNSNSLTNFALPSALTNLGTLNLFNNHLTNFVLPSGLWNLTLLDLGFNSLAQCSLPNGLTNLDTLFLEGNQLANFTLPAGLIRLTKLDLAANGLTTFDFPPDMTNLINVLLFANQLTNVTMPATLSKLSGLLLDHNRLRSFSLPPGLTNLGRLTLLDNQLTKVELSADTTNLNFLDLGGNQLRHFELPAGLTRLNFLRLDGNQLTNLTLPPDLTNLTLFSVRDNPVSTFVLSESMAATSLAETVAALERQGVSIFTYPLAARLTKPRPSVGAFQFAIAGPPGFYTVFGSTNLAVWTEMGTVTNQLGNIAFTDVTANSSPQKFYRAQRQSPPANMVFIPPNTFKMGSPTNELHRQPDEGPQTTVTLTRGFWIGQYEVTQFEYLSVTGTNPSQFPGDLSRPVSSVSWSDATNYCAMLTQRERAAGRIPAGSQYRLPTEAEWECAARAGTTTRFSYGDDPDYASLTNYAWQSLDDGLTVHPVGQKLPNPWGLYDMAGNVFEWCQDWLGPLPGGSVTDPQGPASNPIGWKIMRGGAFDFGGPACRSASRMFFGNHPALTDWNLGFRVVLVIGSQ